MSPLLHVTHSPTHSLFLNLFLIFSSLSLSSILDTLLVLRGENPNLFFPAVVFAAADFAAAGIVVFVVEGVDTFLCTAERAGVFFVGAGTGTGESEASLGFAYSSSSSSGLDLVLVASLRLRV
jgi:hypothetical protein